MKRIGILTIPRAENYGSVLVSYAVQKLIDEIDIDNEIVDYVSPFLVGRYPLFKMRKNNGENMVVSAINGLLTYRMRKIKKKKFASFRRNLRFSSSQINKSSEIEQYKLIVCGGDQIWNTRITHEDTAFFLDFCGSDTRKIAYSVSMGYSDRTRDEIEFYKKNIINFEEIGVREEDDVTFIQQIVGERCDVKCIIDPTLAIEKNIWKQFLTKRIINEPYILVYSMKRDEKIIEAAQGMGKRKKCKIYIIEEEWKKKNRDGFYTMAGMGPIDFLNLVFGAEFIVTNSFHGMAFSIIFEKQFRVSLFEGTEKRMLSLLRILGIKDAILCEEINYNYLIDYKKVNDTLKQQQEKAKLFLARALKAI